jgi:hypothetical protein
MIGNKFYPLKVWLTVLMLAALVCACWPNIFTYPDKMGAESLEFRAGFFFGIFISQLMYSAIIFIGLDLLYYSLTEEFCWSALQVKSALFVFFLSGEFISIHLQHGWTWTHPFFLLNAGIAAIAFYLFDVYGVNWEY